MITDKIFEILGGMECIKNRAFEIDFLANDGLSIEPVSDETVKKYVSGESLCRFEFKLALNTDCTKENIKDVYGFFEYLKSELESFDGANMGDGIYALGFEQEGNFEQQHLSTAQMKYAVKCAMNYYKKGE